MIASETLYRDSGGRIVDESDRAAAYLVCRKGCLVPPDFQQAVADYLKSKGRKVEPPAKPTPPIDPTAAAPENRGLSAKNLRKREG